MITASAYMTTAAVTASSCEDAISFVLPTKGRRFLRDFIEVAKNHKTSLPPFLSLRKIGGDISG